MTTRPLKILAIDDEDDNLFVLRSALSREGMSVDTARSGHEGLHAMSETAYDIILLDLMMPGMTGFEFLETLRAFRTMAIQPVIVVSALTSTDDIVRALALGANDYVTKPIERSVLRERIQTQQRLRWAHQRLADAESMVA